MDDTTKKIKNTIPIENNSDHIDYTDASELEGYKKYISHIVYFDLVKEAYNIVKTLPKFLDEIPDYKRKYANLYSGYQEIIKLAKLVSIPLLSDQEVIDLFEKNFVLMLSTENLIIQDKIEAKLAGIILHDERDVLKAKLKEALERNKEKFTSVNFEENGKRVPASVGGWIKIYISEVGTKIADTVKRQEFFVNNKFYLLLSDTEKKQVRRLLDVYERTKLSSVTMEGLDEPISIFTEDGEHKVLFRGRLEDIHMDPLYVAVHKFLNEGISQEEAKAIATGRKTVESEEADADASVNKDSENKSDEKVNIILHAYRGDIKQVQKIEREERSLAVSAGKDKAKLRGEFYKAIQNKKPEKVVAVLRLMAQTNDLVAFLKEDEKLKNYILAVWPNLYGNKIAEDLKKHPESRQSMQYFVRYILQNRLGWSENDAARIGLQISIIFKKLGDNSYNNISYFDMNTNRFHWTDEKDLK